MDYVLQTFGLTKLYKKNAAVSSANINICRGDIYGFVGENGSGKTTIIRLVTGLIYPKSGSYELFGIKNTDKNILNARKKIAAIVETPSVYLNMSAYDNLKLQCDLRGIKGEDKILQTLKDVGLESLYSSKKHAGDFSLGMRQRLGIAIALIGDPEFMILDEPMNGLDPAGIVEIRELILKLNRKHGITFLISSHILTELSLVATKYGIISKGKIIKEITADELKYECGKFTLIKATDMDALYELLSRILPDNFVTVSGDTAKISGEIDLNAVTSAIIDSGNRILSINCQETSFEEYYLSTVGGNRHD